jgi:ABC-type nitrate/sulfonate/bicarbonate transport system ATPase subunit
MVEFEIHGLSRRFIKKEGRGKPTVIAAVDGLSLAVPAGSFTVILGPSGCGKTTLLRLIAGLERPDAGEIRFRETVRELSKPRIGFMFQDPRLLPWLTVEANLGLAFPARNAETAATIDQVLGLVGLTDWKAAYPRQLSGGMAQRVALGRALCRQPELLLLDEPFGALDAFTRSRLRGDLERLLETLDITVLLVTHDIEEAVYLADRVVFMESGTVRGDLAVPLARPREHRSTAFQDLCRGIEVQMNLPV